MTGIDDRGKEEIERIASVVGEMLAEHDAIARRDADRRVEEARAKTIEECAIVCDDAADEWAEQREFARRIRALVAQAPPRDDATQS